ncbi:hypothetical protein PF002_g11521 [Phytophthora fragariae]|nr:hypothetical protein PF004_g9430 [Phytophthora fragariae]KAE9235469.1 hypothetical protein PF002_g11521 [Phytophthora fragariae]
MDTSCRSIVIAATSSGDPPTTKPAFSARGWLTPPTSVLPTAWKSFVRQLAPPDVVPLECHFGCGLSDRAANDWRRRTTAATRSSADVRLGRPEAARASRAQRGTPARPKILRAHW